MVWLDEIAEVRCEGEVFLIRVEPAGMPQGLSMVSSRITALSVLWAWMRGDRGLHLRVRRFSDDPTGPVLHHEVAQSRSEAVERLTRLRRAIASGAPPWKDPPGES